MGFCCYLLAWLRQRMYVLINVYMYQLYKHDNWMIVNILRPRQDGRHFPDDIFKYIFLNGMHEIWLRCHHGAIWHVVPWFHLSFVCNGLFNNIPALGQIMTGRQSGDKPLNEPVMVKLPTHICVTRLQHVKYEPVQCILKAKFINTWHFLIHFVWWKC